MEKNTGDKQVKVLYIGHYKERSGWGQVTRDNILALDRVGVNVIPRALKLGNPTTQLPERIQQLEYQDPTNCDIIIQHVLPHHMKYDSHFRKNIGIFELETTNIGLTSWPAHLNLMDELWMPCQSMINDCGVNRIIKNVRLVPHTFDTSTYAVEYQKLNLPVKDKFVFYFIGEFNRRKNLGALIKAFHTEFSPEEPVELVLKVNKFGVSAENLGTDIKNFCNGIKDGLKLYKDPQRYKPEIIITVDIPREDIMRLHSTCDCFVCTSHGEAWNLGLFDSMGMGKLVISSATGAMLDYIDSERNGFLVGGKMEPVFGQPETFEEFGTSRERWFDISVSALMATMRRVYELPHERKKTVSTEARSSAKKYDYEIVGQQMKELLNV